MFEKKRMVSIQENFYSNTITTSINENNSFLIGNITTNYNNNLKDTLNLLNSRRLQYQTKVNSLEINDFSMRHKGVSLAWDYEKAELDMGGAGTREWTPEQREEIIRNGKLRGAEGHHIKNVKDNPEHQANPDNIKFAKDKNEHLNSYEFHGGDTKRPTEGELYDRNLNLEKANIKRVIRNELKGIGLAAAIGLGVGFTIGFVSSIAQNGYSVESLKNAFVYSGKMGLASSTIAVGNHIMIRLLGEKMSSTITTILTGNVGLIASENLIKVSNMASAGVICISLCSVLTFIRLKKQGYSFKKSLIGTVQQASVPTIILILSLVAQYKFKGYAGLIVSISLSTVIMGYQIITSIINKNTLDKISRLCIESSEPVFLEG